MGIDRNIGEKTPVSLGVFNLYLPLLATCFAILIHMWLTDGSGGGDVATECEVTSKYNYGNLSLYYVYDMFFFRYVFKDFSIPQLTKSRHISHTKWNDTSSNIQRACSLAIFAFLLFSKSHLSA